MEDDYSLLMDNGWKLVDAPSFTMDPWPYRDYIMEFDVDKWVIAPELKRRLNAIRYGLELDVHEWMYKL